MRSGSTVDFFQENRKNILYGLIKYSNNYSSTILFHKLVCMAGFYILCMLCQQTPNSKKYKQFDF